VSLPSDLLPLLGLSAALVGIADTIPYLRDMLRGKTRPHRGTWLIWSLLSVLVFLSQRADGASWSLVAAGTQVVLNGLILALAACRGVGGLSVGDRAALAIAAGGAIGWAAADAPFVATTCVVVADVLALAMMVPKTYRDPGSETLATFVLAAVGGALATLAVGSADPALVTYPLYLTVANLGLAILIHQRRVAQPMPRFS
jgi:hypothetical protein